MFYYKYTLYFLMQQVIKFKLVEILRSNGLLKYLMLMYQ